MLSKAMSEDKLSGTDYLNGVDFEDLNNDEFDEEPALPAMVRARSNPPSKVDFSCLHDNVIRCVCANIIAHIQSSENALYIPPSEYNLFNKESGSLVSLSFQSFLMFR
jgi:hypothetical protein